MDAVVATELRLAYGRTAALDTSWFTVPRGRVTAVIGPNGSGKSALLHGVAGLLRPQSGSLLVRGVVRYVPQFMTVDEVVPITVREAVTMGRYAGLGPFRRLRALDRQVVVGCLERLEVADLASQPVTELSGGQRQRVFVAQALAQDGDVLLLDEPLAGLDLPSARTIAEVVAAERREGRTVIMATHDLADAADADHVILLAGRTVATGPPGEVLTTEYLHTAYGARLVHLDGGVALDEGSHHH
jgi:ABC-type Mn2+/Zn2+ transport system ATPase subunit